MPFSGESVGAIHGTLELDRDPFTRGLEEARRQVREFESQRHKVTIDAALAGLEKVKAKLAKIRDKHIQVHVDAQVAGLAALQARLASIHGKTVKVTVQQSGFQQAVRNLDFLKTKMGALGTAALVVGPQILGALGQGALGAGALGVATGGAALSFGVLGKAVQDTLSGQATQYQQLKQIATAQAQLTKLQNAGATSNLAQQRAYAALVAAEKSGNPLRIQMAQQHLAIVQSSTQSQLSGNQQLIQAAKQHLAALKADYNGQNQLAQQVNTSISNVKNSIEGALAPAVQQVLHGLLPVLSTLSSAIGGLAGPFKVLGEAVRAAFASPATQAGIRALITGFGQIVKASAPLAGPLVRALIDLGKILENIAKAAMPILVKFTKEFVGWLDKVTKTSGTQHFRDEIKKWADQFGTLVKDIINVGKALLPLFASATGFQPLIAAVTSIVGWFVKLLANAGPVGRLFLGGLGIAFIAGKFSGLKSALGLAGGAFKLLGAAVLGLVTKSFGPLLTAFPGLVTAFWGLDAVVSGGTVAAFGTAALAVLPFVAAVVGIGALVFVVIKFHKQIIDAIVDAWDWIKKHIKTVLIAIALIVTGGFGLVVFAVIKWHKKIEEAISAAWKFIKHVIGDALKWIEHAISDAWKLIEKAVSAAWKLIEKAVAEGIKLVVLLMVKLPLKMVLALGNLGKILFDAGKQIMQGLFNGLLSMIGGLAGIGGKIVDTITGSIGGLLGISSPSKKAHWWGQMIGEGLAQGIESSHGRVRDAAARLANAATIGATGSIGIGVSGQGGASASRGLVIHNHFTFSSLVPATPAEKRQLAHTVIGAIRDASPGSIPR